MATQTSDALDVYTNQTYAYNGGCFPQPDDTVACIDNTGVWAIRGEATDMWRTYLDLRTQRDAAQAVADDAAATLAAAQADLADWNTAHATRVTAETAAQAAIDTADADLITAQATIVSAAANIADQQDVLDALLVAAAPLTETLAAAEYDEQRALRTANKFEAALTALTKALDEAVSAYETSLRTHNDAERALSHSYTGLAKAQDYARNVKDRLQAARTHNR